MSVITADFISEAGTTTDALTSYELSCPILGIDSVLDAGDVAATNTDPDFPITNVVNPATHLVWKSTGATSAEITLVGSYAEHFDYIGIAGHNLGLNNVSCNISVSSDASAALLHFEGADASTTITNSGYYAQTWTAHGNAQIDTAQFKFGSASLLCDGSGDYVDTPDNNDVFDFDAEDFTIDMWVRPNASGAMNAAGQVDAAGMTSTNSTWRIRKTSTNTPQAAVVQGTTVTTLDGTTVMSNGTWYHMALVRKDDVLYFFLNGVLQSQAAFTGSLNDSTEPVTLGRGGSQTGTEWNGWIDEFHILFGAIWTSAFTPPTAAWPSTLLSSTSLTFDPSEIIIRFPVPLILNEVVLSLSWSSGDKQIAAIYLGKLIVMERSIKIDPWHTILSQGQKINAVGGMSESGNFLGRTVLSQYSETKAEFSYVTLQWYRDYMGDFKESAYDTPFFWAWAPTDYPTDTGYAWLISDLIPEVDPVTRRVAFELHMRGLTE